MPPPYPSSCGAKPRPSDIPGKTSPSFLSAVASTPTKKIARPASVPNRKALQSSPPGSSARRRSWLARNRSRPPPHQPSTPTKQSAAAALPRQQAACGSKKPESEFMAPRDAKTVHPARRLAPGTAVCVRTRFTMITEKCCLVIWLPARVVSALDAYHCTVKYSADLSPAYAGKVVRKPVDHVRVRRAAVKAEPGNMAPPPSERQDRFL